jgi:glycosyltransferase involved in cell wall biosynthesis
MELKMVSESTPVNLQLPPRVSIGLPIYNGAAFVKNALDMLLNQTEKNFELIISDNNSSDGSTEILLTAAAGDSRIRYYRHEKRLSMYDNFHYVLSHARGAYFMWAACDDGWDVDFIEKLAQRLDSQPKAIMAFGDVIIVTPTDKVGNLLPFDFQTMGLGVVRRLQKLARLQCFYIYGLWRTDQIKSVPYSYCAWWPDLPLMLAASILGPFLYVPKVCFYYYEVPKSNLTRVMQQDYVTHFNLLMGIGGLIVAVYRACSKKGGLFIGGYAATLVVWKQLLTILGYIRRRLVLHKKWLG